MTFLFKSIYNFKFVQGSDSSKYRNFVNQLSQFRFRHFLNVFTSKYLITILKNTDLLSDSFSGSRKIAGHHSNPEARFFCFIYRLVNIWPYFLVNRKKCISEKLFILWSKHGNSYNSQTKFRELVIFLC